MIFVAQVLCMLLPALSMCGPVREPRVGRSITYKNCGPDVIKDITLSPCQSEPCTFQHGINVSVGITFTSEDSASAITAKVYGIVEGIPVPYSIPQADGCTGCNLTCPLQSGMHWYMNTFPVLPMYPDIKLAVKWELVDDKSQQFVCFEFPMAIDG